MTSKATKLNPTLRFQGFSEGWRNIQIEDLVKAKILAKPMDGNHGNIHPKGSDFVKDGIPFVMANSFQNGKVNLKETLKITREQADGLQKGFSRAGDVLLTHKGSIGLTAIVPELEDDYVMLTPQVTYYRVTNPRLLCHRFLRTYFDTAQFQKLLAKLGAGGTRAYVGITEQRSLTLRMPLQPEQKKIADFLTSVDDRIGQLIKKKALLEDYKKGVMQQLFSQQIRFKDDNGNDFPDWEEKKLGELATCLDNLRRPVNATEREKMKGDIPYYGANGIQGYVNDFIFDEDLTLLAEDGGNFDEFSNRPIAQRVTGKAWVNNHAHILRAKPLNMTPAFLFHSLVHKDIRKYINGSSRAKLNKGDMLTIAMIVPNVLEQKKIADFLSAIDQKIESVSQQIAKTQTFKKGLLQQMFV